MKKYLLLLGLLPSVAAAQQISSPSSTNPLTVATAGANALTGTVSETNLAALKIPAGSLGTNGSLWISCLWSYTNSSNAKTMTIRFTSTSGATSGGVIGTALSVTTTAAAQTLNIIRENNATNAQLSWAQAGNTPFNTGGTTATVLAVDTTQDSYINVNGTLANSGETLTLQHCSVFIYKN